MFPFIVLNSSLEIAWIGQVILSQNLYCSVWNLNRNMLTPKSVPLVRNIYREIRVVHKRNNTNAWQRNKFLFKLQ